MTATGKRAVHVTSQFRKDLKQALKHHKCDLAELKAVMQAIENRAPLDAKYLDANATPATTGYWCIDCRTATACILSAAARIRICFETMKAGEHVRHISRPDIGYGRVTGIHDDDHCDVEFASGTFSWLPFSTFVSANEEVALKELDRLLEAADFSGADDHFSENCRGYMESTEYVGRREKAVVDHRERLKREEVARIAFEQKALREEVLQMLDDFDVKAADEKYHERCSDWWDGGDYEQHRSRAIAICSVLAKYRDCSLKELNALLADKTNTSGYRRRRSRS